MSSIVISRDRAWTMQVKRWTDATQTTADAFEAGTFACQIRRGKSTDSTPTVTVTVDDTDRATGVIVLSLTDAQVSAWSVDHPTAWLDVKRTVAGEDYTVVPPVKVVFEGSVTA